MNYLVGFQRQCFFHIITQWWRTDKKETYSTAFLSSLLRIFRLYPVIFMSLYKYCSIVSGFFKQGWLEEKRARSSGQLPLEVFSFGLRHYEFLSRDDALKLTLSSRFWKCYHTTAKVLNTCLYFVFAKWRAGNSNIFPTEVDDAGRNLSTFSHAKNISKLPPVYNN